MKNNKVKIVVEGDTATVTMPREMLAVIRYTLSEGAMKLAGTASYLRALRSELADSAQDAADGAMAARHAMEEANIQYVYGGGPKKSPKSRRGGK